MIWLPLIAMPSLADPTAADQQVGAWAFVIVLALVVGTFLLWFNMRKQLGKINVPYANETEEGEVAGETETSPEKGVVTTPTADNGESRETGEAGPGDPAPPAGEKPTQS